MNNHPLVRQANLKHQELKALFFENENADRVFSIVQENVSDALAAQATGLSVETRGIAVLGRSGAGKTASVLQALSQLGFKQTKPGDEERPFLLVRLGANASLKAVSADCLAEIGWRARTKDSARSIWADVVHYMKELKTIILVLDEIQHVRTTGPSDKAALRDFLKSLVQPSQHLIIPIVVGMEEFREVLVSDDQLRRRFDQVQLRDLSPVGDLEKPIKVLNQYATQAELQLDKSVMSRDFAERLLHAANFAFGEMCAICLSGIRRAASSGYSTVEIIHFQEAYARRTDCVPAMNPFIAADFQNIDVKDHLNDP